LIDTATAASVFEFGPGGAYLGYISDPSRPRSQTGVIVFGMGRLESRIARRLAALGLVVMQIQLFRNYADMRRRLQFYDDAGVAACAAAIEAMFSKRRITQVVLMGDCAEANVSFNTALTDRRVVGLILTNPNLDAQLARLTVIDRLPLRLFNMNAWRRLVTGDSRLLKSILRRFGSSSAGQWLAGQMSFHKDVILPLDFEQKLSALLTERAGRSLIVFSKDRNGLSFFRKFYAATLQQLMAANRLTFEVMPVNARDDPADDQLTCQFADVIADWAAKALVSRDPKRIEIDS
jgi:hypothetical protein